ncbi:protein of unknown function [Nitrospira defluvii]|uniref:Uncharacterized protein n=1 Tax=Nitrospira defluvii TaxID=330214 RepID=D8PFH0_9BACT|nr:protein of unknown function [Nitrospira defluvii]
MRPPSSEPLLACLVPPWNGATNEPVQPVSTRIELKPVQASLPPGELLLGQVTNRMYEMAMNPEPSPGDLARPGRHGRCDLEFRS